MQIPDDRKSAARGAAARSPGRVAGSAYPGPMARRLSQEDLALVVKRAAELHLSGAGQPDAMLDEEAVLSVLQEAGVSKDAAGQALSEWRRGSLEHGITLPAPMPRTTMDPTAAVARRLAIPSDRVVDVLDAALSRHLFMRGRRNGHNPLGGEWVPRTGLLADLRRGLDFRGSLMLKDLNRIRVDVLPAGPDDSRVTLTADISSYRSRLLGFLVGVPVVAAVGLGIGGLVESSLELGLIGTPLAALAAGGGYQGAAHLLEQQREKTREALDIFLDRLG
jgi:hypothetical protein